MKTQALIVSLVVGLAGLGACGGGGGSPAPAAPATPAAASPPPEVTFVELGFLEGVRAIEAKVCACRDKACLVSVSDSVPAWWKRIQSSDPTGPSGREIANTVYASFDHIDTCWATIEAGATLLYEGRPWRHRVAGEGLMVVMRGMRNVLCACQDMACAETAQETLVEEMSAVADPFHGFSVPSEVEDEGDQIIDAVEACTDKLAAASGSK